MERWVAAGWSGCGGLWRSAWARWPTWELLAACAVIGALGWLLRLLEWRPGGRGGPGARAASSSSPPSPPAAGGTPRCPRGSRQGEDGGETRGGRSCKRRLAQAPPSKALVGLALVWRAELSITILFPPPGRPRPLGPQSSASAAWG